MKKYCKMCKFCSDVVNNNVVSCDSDCRWKERPSYKRYMLELEKSNATINPVTGDRNDSCPAHSNYGYIYHEAGSVIDVAPAQYVKCAVRNKRFDCKHYIKTDKAPYISDILCPHCNLKMKIFNDRWYGCAFYGNENVYMKADSCDFSCTVDDDGKIIGFDVYESDYEYHEYYDEKYYRRSRELGAVVVDVKTRLGITIDRSDYGWTDGGDYFKKKDKPVVKTSCERRSFWRWLIND